MCPIFFSIYGMKLNEVYFSSGTGITNFLDKPYQKKKFKSHLNSVLPCKLGKMLSDLHMSCGFYFTLLGYVQFNNEIDKVQL